MLESKEKIIIVGYSGHSYVIIDTLIELGYNIFGYIEKNELTNNPYNLRFLGNEKDLNFKLFVDGFSYVVAIGDNKTRSSVSNFLRLKFCKILNVINPSSSISNNIRIGSGVFIARNVSVSPFCEIGDDVVINNSAVVDHECIIESGSHIAPGSILLGNVKVGRNTLVGAGSVVREGIKIGNNVVIGAGSVVLKDVKDDKLVYGSPAK